MIIKYRVRLSNGRVLGPFLEKEVVELFNKKHIDGSEDCQQFPVGEWKKLSDFPVLMKKFQGDEQEESQESTNKNISTGTKSTKIAVRTKEKTRTDIGEFKDFSFQKGGKIEVDYKALEKKYREENNLEEEPEDKTVIIRGAPKKVADKTVIVKRLDDPTAPSKKEIIKPVKVEPPKPSKEEIVQESTQFLDLQSVLPRVNTQLANSEVEFEKQAKIEENQERLKKKREEEKKFKEDLLRRQKNSNDDEDDETPKKKKGMSWIVMIAFIAIIYVLLDQEEPPKKTGPEFQFIKYPITREFEDKNLALANLSKAREAYARGTYKMRNMASELYVQSLENLFLGNPAIGEIILNYAELLENAKDENKAAHIIYKLIRISDKEMLSDPNVALGAALLFHKIEKHYTAINTIKNYLRVKGSPSTKMLGYYLEFLVAAGDITEAGKIYKKLVLTSKKPFETYISMAKFLKLEEKKEEAVKLLEEATGSYPSSVALQLFLGELYIETQSKEGLDGVVKKLKKIGYEESPYFYARTLKLFGLYSALNNDNKEAIKLLRQSLELREDEELRIKLSFLEVSGNQLADKLILESKMYTLVKKAREEIKNKNYEVATGLLAEALSGEELYLPALIAQADLQIIKGQYDAAINTLKLAIDPKQTNSQLLKIIISTYIKAFKYEQAVALLIDSRQMKFALTSEYAYLYGLLNEGKGNNTMAIKYYEESIRRNPLDDRTMFSLSKLLFRIKKFREAKAYLKEAIILDPKNIEYLALNALIIFEQDGADVANGYLRDLMSELGEHPRLMSTIATIYFRTGMINEFKSYYKKVQEMPKKDEGFYEFLIAATKLEGAMVDYENYSRELLKINPGNLKARMDLAEVYFQRGKFQDAVDELSTIKESLISYPKVHFMLAKVYIAQKNLKEAKKMAETELKLNPNLDSAHFIVGEVQRAEGMYREAVQSYEKAISLNPKSADPHMSLGWIKLNQNQTGEALELYSKAQRLDPSNPEVYRQLGDCYKAAGQRAVAKEKYQDYLKLNPAAVDKEEVEKKIKSL